MLVALDIVLVVMLAFAAVAGVRRGLWPEVVALGGLLLGALLAGEWGDVWGGDLGAAIGLLGPAGARMIVRTLLFLVPLIAIGYGGALLLPRQGAPSPQMRVVGAALGLFNGAAIVAVLLRNWHYSQVPAGSPLTGDPITAFLLEWAGWWPIVLALGSILAVIAVAARRPRRAARPAPISTGGPVPAPVVSSSSVPAPMPVAAPRSSAATPMLGSPAPAPRPALLPDALAAPSPGAPANGSAAKSLANGTTPDEHRCRTCNHLLAPGAAFCPNCGTPV